MMVSAIKQRLGGKLFQDNGRCALLVRSQKPEKGAPDSLYVRYAFTVQGTEAPFFPESLLDDWGKEITKLPLYKWVRQFGAQFPRAEVFGFTLEGKATQRFLREMELYAKLRCYAYPTKDVSLVDGLLVQAVLWPDDGVHEPELVKRPFHEEEGRVVEQPLIVERPLRGIQASWWRVPPDLTHFDFSQLPRLPEADY